MSDSVTIEVVANPISTIPTAKGSYQVIDLAYKNKTFQDKLEGKKVMSFTNKDVFTALQKASFGDTFNVTRIKNDKGFWDWTAVSSDSIPNNSISNQKDGRNLGLSNAPIVRGNPAPRSNYETPEERAARQVLIVRQSSISNAVEFAVANKIRDEEEVLRLATRFEAHVFGNHTTGYMKEETTTTANSFFEGMEDDLPS